MVVNYVKKGIVIAVIMVAAAVIWLSGRAVTEEESRWQASLSAEAAQITRHIDQWIAQRQSQVQSLAVNPTLQLYMSELSTTDSAAIDDAQAQRFFVQQLMDSSRAGLGLEAAQLQLSDAAGETLFSSGDALPINTPLTENPQLIAYGDAQAIAWQLPISGIQTSEAQANLRAVLPVNADWLNGMIDEAMADMAIARSTAASANGTVFAQAAPTEHEAMLAAEVSSTRLPELTITRSVARDVALEAPYTMQWMVWALAALALAGALWIARQQTTSQDNSLLRQRTSALKKMVQVIVDIAEMRDPNAAHHSHRVSELSRMLAERAGLTHDECELTETAGLLMNVGKVMVSDEILTQLKEITNSQRQHVRDAISRSADMMEGIDIYGPVSETIRQSQSPMGASNQNMPARIIALSNRFVTMTSDRHYRKALSQTEAMVQLQKLAGKDFDAKLVDLLASHLRETGEAHSRKEMAVSM